MPTYLQPTDQTNPLAQSFKVTEQAGSVITGIGVFFATAPTATDDQLPVTIELRPMVDAGVPSSKIMYKGTRVSATAAAIRAVASTTYSSATEYKFTFEQPVFLPNNVEVAFCLRSSAPAGKYQVWYGKIGDFVSGSTTKRVTTTLDAGAYFSSSNGTTWSPNQSRDLAFKVYRAAFKYDRNMAVLTPNYPVANKLTSNPFTTDPIRYGPNPLVFTNGSSNVGVLHPHHGFQVGQKVNITANSFDSADTLNGIQGADILGEQLITAVDPYGYTFNSGSTATSTGRNGGNDVFAEEQYVADAVRVNLDHETPPDTTFYAAMRMPTYKSFAGATPVSKYHEDMGVTPYTLQSFKEPHYIANERQVNNDGDLISQIKVVLGSENKYVAPYIDLHSSSLEVHSNFLDYQDSASTSNRNLITTIPFVSETEPNGGTTASKHISLPYLLQEAATSIRVYVDAVRPTTGDFSVWYRTNNSASTTKLADKNWIEFSKTSEGPNTSNYNDIPPSDARQMAEYQFNVYDINSFDEYQIKITMNSTNSAKTFRFKNLRTIATV